ncbi:MAG: pseudouridine synthase [Promicromonosporaceae bacterium]|nr:pseudouridine synthase [Promicromonosporaceae bacterium]
MSASPLPVRDGLNPTRLVLPHEPLPDGAPPAAHWPTALDYLLERFPADRDRLRALVEGGEVVDQLGRPIGADTPYRPRGLLFLYRDPPADEPEVPQLAEIEVLHRDEDLLVIDKPHLVSVMPRGRWVTQTALVYLRRELDLPDLSPAHRLDRPTAGVLVFTVRASVRGAYQQLFQRRAVEKVYEAVAPLPSSAELRFPLTVTSRIVKRRGTVAAEEVPGVPNAESRIDLVARDEARRLGLYRLEPRTGKTHQLRLHMNSVGLPITGDPFFPVLRASEAEDPAQPLQLLARRLRFADPLSGVAREFESRRRLSEWPA